jgi:Group II intron, maturase-specific domain
MTRECHVRFCERLAVRFRRATHRNIYVRSEKAGHRVMTSLTRFIEGRLKLQVNAQKSAVARPWQRSVLGFTVTDEPQPRRRIADKAVARFKDRVRELTRRHRGVSLDRMIADLNPLLRGWAGYFGFSQWRELGSLDGWTRRRLRCVVWVQWKTRGNRYRELRRLRVSDKVASAAISWMIPHEKVMDARVDFRGSGSSERKFEGRPSHDSSQMGLTIAPAALLVGIIAAVGTWVASGGGSVTADHGSVAAGHDVTNSTIAPGARQ